MLRLDELVAEVKDRVLEPLSNLIGSAAASVNPVPASRPRVTRWGTYYSPRYKNWKTAVAGALVTIGRPFTCPVVVVVEHIVQKPKTTERAWPIGDIDNYEKATLDAVTQSERLWADDDQVVAMVSTKRYATPNETPGTYVDIYEIEP